MSGYIVKTPGGDIVCATQSEAARTLIRYAIEAGDELALRDVHVYDATVGRLRAVVELLAPIDY
jgi:hypothetical protein